MHSFVSGVLQILKNVIEKKISGVLQILMNVKDKKISGVLQIIENAIGDKISGVLQILINAFGKKKNLEYSRYYFSKHIFLNLECSWGEEK